jgi:hypothetical protein
MIKSRRMRWVEHVKRKGELKNSYSILVGKSKGRLPLAKLGVYWRILEWV